MTSLEKYFAGKAIHDTELRQFHKDLGLTLKKLFEIGLDKDPLFAKLNKVLVDVWHMISERKKMKVWKPIKRKSK